MPFVPPETRYAKSGHVNVAYQVVGDGPLDLVYVHGWVSNVEYGWEVPPLARFLRRLASFSRLILFDRRGTGLSDRVSTDELPTLEERMDDVRAVMDAVGTERAALFGVSEGGNLAALFCASYPARTSSLVTFGIYAKRTWSPDYPWAPTPEERQKELEEVETGWGQSVIGVGDSSADETLAAQISAFFRQSASPGAAAALLRMNTEIDIRSVLPAIRVPTLVMHRTGDTDVNVEEGRWIADQIPGAKFVEIPGGDHVPWVGDQEAILATTEEFLTGERPLPEADRVLVTVLFTDIVGSTELAAELGDRRWRELLEAHHAEVRKQLGRFRGQEVDTAGDGFFAAFDGPARGVRAACAIGEKVRSLGIDMRAGLHTGECELMGGKMGGIAVHTGARVASEAGPSEVLVSQTVKDLVAGSGIVFEDRGIHDLKGVPGEWRLYAVVDA